MQPIECATHCTGASYFWTIASRCASSRFALSPSSRRQSYEKCSCRRFANASMNSPYWSWSTQPQQPICVSGSPITAPSLACTSASHFVGSASDGVGNPSAARTGMNASAPVLRIVQPISPWIMQSGGSFAACVLLISTAMSSGEAEKRCLPVEAQLPIFGGGVGPAQIRWCTAARA